MYVISSEFATEYINSKSYKYCIQIAQNNKSEYTDWSTLDSNSCKDNIPSFFFAASVNSIPAYVLHTNYLHTAETQP